ncbi:hypothetical protein F5884DRAFT_528732 [Xylogone sp. PMI_703]|nr:hypothetical protein F5884DRAFT_528732 [Xylogone sp. PMI_703]
MCGHIEEYKVRDRQQQINLDKEARLAENGQIITDSIKKCVAGSHEMGLDGALRISHRPNINDNHGRKRKQMPKPNTFTPRLALESHMEKRQKSDKLRNSDYLGSIDYSLRVLDIRVQERTQSPLLREGRRWQSIVSIMPTKQVSKQISTKKAGPRGAVDTLLASRY